MSDVRDPYLGAVGMLQFEVLRERLKNEYRVKCCAGAIVLYISQMGRR